MNEAFLNDPSWYLDAVIYELHVRSFYDANNDGYGDFKGLREKLPYLESLGVNTLWLLPFLKSPLKDDGYDTSDYYDILPVHGSIEEFKAFLGEAHQRGMRVITELVLNHTSDQHPWFQEARNPASPKHHWYVWSETTERYKEARIIFTDTEVSNWTWDRKAGKYYWHRFFSHQPDLNYDHPEVRQAMKEAMFYWLDLGVDGLRLDAVPYLYEREGANCENLPETIRYIADLRAAVEERYGPGRVLLAEANQWPEDTLPYFADGKGVQMAFNFPIMPRMYMALRRESRHPLVSMLELTQQIPEGCQWAIFLRNHDELTLEMVTDEERDYMYYEYAKDPRFRINVGIRRRLAPLLGGERRRIELMNALLLSLKGSPVLYYGDEIGMGDDPFLGDRNGVRTPMQWSPDKNGGFSRAPHHRLFMPSIDHGPYSFEFINVEDAEANPHSLLNFMKRLLLVRRQHGRTFGRGEMRVLPVANDSILAFTRAYEGETLLVVANLSRFVQAARIAFPEEMQGCVPVELFSKSPFPAVGAEPYMFSLGPHGFYWFRLQSKESIAATGQAPADGEAADESLPTLTVREGLHNLLIRTMASDRDFNAVEEVLPRFVAHQRWFGHKDKAVRSVAIVDAVRLMTTPATIYLTVIEARYEGGADRYLLPLMLAYGDDAGFILENRPHTALAWVQMPEGKGLLFDAAASPTFWEGLFAWMLRGGKGRSLRGTYLSEMRAAPAHEVCEARLLSGEQTNSAAIVDGAFFIKLYRHIGSGFNPEAELLEHLSRVGFPYIPQVRGQLLFRRAETDVTIGIVQDAVRVESDGWAYALELLRRALDRLESGQADGARPGDAAPELFDLARTLGARTAEMHRALAQGSRPGLAPEPGGGADVQQLAARVREEMAATRRMLGDAAPPDAPGEAAWAPAQDLVERIGSFPAPKLERIRIHGDYHLGQTIRAGSEFYIIDFEGEPARSIEERRRPDFAYRDLAGMLRSLDYAVQSAVRERAATHPEMETFGESLTGLCETSFLTAYYTTAADNAFAQPQYPSDPLLWLYLLDKALYEVRYELSHRPDWVWLPLKGLRRLLAAHP